MNGFYLGLAAFALVFAAGFRWVQLIQSVSLPDNRIGFLLCMVTGMGLAITSFFHNPGWIGGTLAALALIPSCFFVFTWAISAQKGGPGKLQPGSPLMAFTAIDDMGSSFDSGVLVGKPVLLKFFRGHW